MKTLPLALFQVFLRQVGFSRWNLQMCPWIPGTLAGAAEICLQQASTGIPQGRRTKPNVGLVRNTTLWAWKRGKRGCTPTRMTQFCKMAQNVTHGLMRRARQTYACPPWHAAPQGTTRWQHVYGDYHEMHTVSTPGHHSSDVFLSDG